jgi:hypothetical protein
MKGLDNDALCSEIQSVATVGSVIPERFAAEVGVSCATLLRFAEASLLTDNGVDNVLELGCPTGMHDGRYAVLRVLWSVATQVSHFCASFLRPV